MSKSENQVFNLSAMLYGKKGERRSIYIMTNECQVCLLSFGSYRINGNLVEQNLWGILLMVVFIFCEENILFILE